jgi:hypothetical protein
MNSPSYIAAKERERERAERRMDIAAKERERERVERRTSSPSDIAAKEREQEKTERRTSSPSQGNARGQGSVGPKTQHTQPAIAPKSGSGKGPNRG